MILFNCLQFPLVTLVIIMVQTFLAQSALTVPNPCSVLNGGCGQNAICSEDDTSSEVICTCRTGYINGGNDKYVRCIDSCRIRNGGCKSSATCAHVYPSNEVICIRTTNTTNSNYYKIANVFDAVNSDKPVYIKNALGNAYLHVQAPVPRDYAPITVWEKVDMPNIKWYIQSTEIGFHIQTAMDRNFVVGQTGMQQNNDGPVALWNKIHHYHYTSLRVNFVRAGYGYYRIKFVHSGKLLQPINGNIINGSPVTQWEYGSHPSLLWSIEWA